MDKKVTFLTPIEQELPPPPHSKIQWPRCFTCNKFEVCNLRADYLKSCLLIEEILGNPQENLELQKSNPNANCGCYKGNPIEDADTLFPATVQFSKRTLPNGDILTDVVEGNFVSAIYQDFNTVLFQYESQGYIIIFKAIYNQLTQEYDIKNGVEVVYGIIYEFPADNVLEVQVNLDTWRAEMEEKEKEHEDIDIINTTYFSVLLNCDFYQPIKNLSPIEGAKRIIAKYPEGVPCGNGQYYHLETLHIEPHKIPWYNPNAGKTAFAPMPYPIFVPRPCKPKKVYRYDDLND